MGGNAWMWAFAYTSTPPAGSMAGGPFLVIGLLWLGWSGNYASVHWIVPTLATVALGMSFTLVSYPQPGRSPELTEPVPADLHLVPELPH